jgi:hypothetical protein
MGSGSPGEEKKNLFMKICDQRKPEIREDLRSKKISDHRRSEIKEDPS